MDYIVYKIYNGGIFEGVNNKKSIISWSVAFLCPFAGEFHRFFLRAASLAGLSSPEKGLDLKIFFTISFP